MEIYTKRGLEKFKTKRQYKCKKGKMNEQPVAWAIFHFIVIYMSFTLFLAFVTVMVNSILVFNLFRTLSVYSSIRAPTFSFVKCYRLMTESLCY